MTTSRRTRLTARTVRCAALALALAPAGAALAQPSAPFKDATTNPCAFDAGLSRNVRCATPGQVVSWAITSTNTTGSDQVVSVTDGAPTPAGCMTFACDPILLVNGMPVPLPPGSTCDPASGFTIPGISWPSNATLEVRFESTLSGSLAAGESCANIGAVVYFGPFPTMEPDRDCQVDVGGTFPTILTTCGPPSGTPDFQLVKTAETPAGTPLADVGDGDTVCFRLRVENTGSAPGRVEVHDAFDSHFSALDFDADGPFATGTCGWSGNALACAGLALAGGGGSDEARICGTFTCTNGMADVQNSALLLVTDPPTGTVVMSRPCSSCPAGPTTLPVVQPRFTSSTKTVTLVDRDANGCASPGDDLRFELTAVNDGSDAAADVTFLDADPAGAADAGDCEWSVRGGPFAPCPAIPPVGFSLGAMAPGDQPIVVRWSATIASVTPDQDLCDEACTLVAAECDASWYAPQVCVPGCASGPLLRIQKTGQPEAVFPGEDVAYLLRTCNTGDLPAARVVVRDPIPSCAIYVPGSMTIGPTGGVATALTDVADRDAGAFVASPAEAAWDVTAFLGRDLAVGECMDLRLSLTAQECPGPEIGYWNTPTATVDGSGTPVQVGSEFTQVLVPAPVPTLTKAATPGPTVGPGDVINYTLRACNHRSATADLLDVVVSDDVPACTDFVPGSLRIEGVPATDAAGDDAADFVPGGPAGGAVAFRVGLLAPGECVDFTWQARVRLDCGGQLVSNTATLAWGSVGQLIESNLSQVGVATHSLVKTATDVDGARFVQGDEVEYAVTFCNGSPFTADGFLLTDVVPGTAVTPPSECDASYVAGSMTLELPGVPPFTLTDGEDGDQGWLLPGPPDSINVRLGFIQANACITVRFRVRADLACLDGECLSNQARATWGIPPTSLDSNVADICLGAFIDGTPYRLVGFASMVATGGCEFGPRLREFACPEIPATCREDAPGTRWIMMNDAVPQGDLVTFYEVPSAACCAATPSDASYLTVRKVTGTPDVALEIVFGCP